MKRLTKIGFVFALLSLVGACSSAYADSTALSRNWAGYISDGSGYTAVGATWVVPTVSTTLDPAADATWVGIGGVTGSDLIQSGTQAIVQNGTVSYQAWVELLPQELKPIILSVKPGDSVTVSLVQTSSGEWHLSFKNNTTGGDYENDIAYASSLTSAEWIQEKPAVEGGGQISLDMFTPVQFTNAYAVDNGVRRTIAQSDSISISLLSGGQSTLASPSALGSDGASFIVTRGTSNSTSAVTSFPTSYSNNPSYQQFLPPWKRVDADGGSGTGTASVTIGRQHGISVLIQRFSGGSGSPTLITHLQLPSAELRLLQALQGLMNQVYTR